MSVWPAGDPAGAPEPRDGGADVVPVDPALRLVQRCRRGDETAWRELYRREGPAVARFVRRLLGPGEAADDAIQQVFVELFRSLPQYRGEASLRTWLYRIAAHVASRRLRGERRRERYAAAFEDEPGGAVAAVSPERRVAAREELARIAEAVDRLPLKQRLVWVLCEVEELSMDEAAAALGVSGGTVRSRLHHARRKVAARLAARAKREGRP